MNKINLYGAGGHAKVIIDILRSENKSIGDIYDDNPNVKQIFDIPVKNSKKEIIKGPLIISIGSNYLRKTLAKRLICPFEKALSPYSLISSTACINIGSVVMPGVIIQAEVRIGKHCIINSGSVIEHECIINDFVHISPNSTICGNVTIGEGSWIGAGSIIIPGIKIGKWTIIGAGSVVIKDIPDNVKAYGNPCKIKEKLT